MDRARFTRAPDRAVEELDRHEPEPRPDVRDVVAYLPATAVAWIRELQPWSPGDLRIVLSDGTKLTLSRGYRDRIPGTYVLSDRDRQLQS